MLSRTPLPLFLLDTVRRWVLELTRDEELR